MCKASSTADQTMCQKLCQPWKTAPPTSAPGVLPSACSLMPNGLALQQTCARFRQMLAAFVSALQCNANDRRLQSWRDARCWAVDARAHVPDSAVMLLPPAQTAFFPWATWPWYHCPTGVCVWIIVMSYSPAFQPRHWRHCRVCSMPPLVWLWTYDPTYNRPSRNCTGYQSTRGSTTSCACWSTRRRSGRRRLTSPTCWHLSPVSSHWALSAQPPTATTLCRVHIASIARGLFQSPNLKLGTGCRPNWKRQLVPLTVSNALSKHFDFSLPTAVKHVLADFCNAPLVRL